MFIFHNIFKTAGTSVRKQFISYARIVDEFDRNTLEIPH